MTVLYFLGAVVAATLGLRASRPGPAIALGVLSALLTGACWLQAIDRWDIAKTMLRDAATAISGVTSAKAHDFYSAGCCSGNDCGPLPLGSVEWTPAGWHVRLPTGWTPTLAWKPFSAYPKREPFDETIPFGDTRLQRAPDDDRRFHLCLLPWKPNEAHCVYVPGADG